MWCRSARTLSLLGARDHASSVVGHPSTQPHHARRANAVLPHHHHHMTHPGASGQPAPPHRALLPLPRRAPFINSTAQELSSVAAIDDIGQQP